MAAAAGNRSSGGGSTNRDEVLSRDCCPSMEVEAALPTGTQSLEAAAAEMTDTSTTAILRTQSLDLEGGGSGRRGRVSSGARSGRRARERRGENKGWALTRRQHEDCPWEDEVAAGATAFLDRSEDENSASLSPRGRSGLHSSFDDALHHSSTRITAEKVGTPSALSSMSSSVAKRTTTPRRRHFRLRAAASWDDHEVSASSVYGGLGVGFDGNSLVSSAPKRMRNNDAFSGGTLLSVAGGDSLDSTAPPQVPTSGQRWHHPQPQRHPAATANGYSTAKSGQTPVPFLRPRPTTTETLIAVPKSSSGTKTSAALPPKSGTLSAASAGPKEEPASPGTPVKKAFFVTSEDFLPGTAVKGGVGFGTTTTTVRNPKRSLGTVTTASASSVDGWEGDDEEDQGASFAFGSAAASAERCPKTVVKAPRGPTPLSARAANAGNLFFDEEKPAPSEGANDPVVAAASVRRRREDSLDDSVLSHDRGGTPFRFSSFPATLPRIHNRNSNGLGEPHLSLPQPQPAPGTVRKRMSFGNCLLPNAPSCSSADEEETTHNNTSLSSSNNCSSLDIDDGDHNHREGHDVDHGDDESSPARTRTRLDFNTVLSPDAAATAAAATVAPGGRSVGVNPVCAVVAHLTDEPQGAQGNGDNINKNALSHYPYFSQKPEHVLVDVASRRKRQSSCAANDSTKSSAGMTPSRSRSEPVAGRAAAPQGEGGGGSLPFTDDRPTTPREVRLRLALDVAQCSPIPGIPEEDDCIGNASHGCGNETSATARHHHRHQPQRTHIRHGHKQAAVETGSSLHGLTSSFPSSAGRNCDESRRKQRRPSRAAAARPMPDMKAFCDDFSAEDSTTPAAPATNCRSHSQLTPSQAHPPSPKLLCPPTPVRTPTWAAHCGTAEEAEADAAAVEAAAAAAAAAAAVGWHRTLQPQARPPSAMAPVAMKYGRSNSLIATKVLATCSQHMWSEPEDVVAAAAAQGETQHHKFQRTKEQESGACSETETIPGEEEEEEDTVMDDAEPTDPSSRDESEGYGGDADDWLHDARSPPLSQRRIKSRRNIPEVMDHIGVNANGKNGNVRTRSKDALAAPLPEAAAAAIETGDVVVSLSSHFDILAFLGRGTFGDAFRVRCRADGRLYAVKRSRRPFRGRRDRERALQEVRTMQRLQTIVARASGNSSNVDDNHNSSLTDDSCCCLYLLHFYQAWQEEGHFYCQTELCCRDTLREVMDACLKVPQWNAARLRYPCLARLPLADGVAAATEGGDAPTETLPSPSSGRLFPELTVWKVCHDVAAGLSHMHARGLVHHDIKPSNVFLVRHRRLGAVCKIGDFGMAGETGSPADGQEGDCMYMAPELLQRGGDVRRPAADLFSLGLTLTELTCDGSFWLASQGPRWHALRPTQTAGQQPAAPLIVATEISKHGGGCRSPSLVSLIGSLLHGDPRMRPSAAEVANTAATRQQPRFQDGAGDSGGGFGNLLRDYLEDVEDHDRHMAEQEERRMAGAPTDKTPRGPPRSTTSVACRSPVVPQSQLRQQHQTQTRPRNPAYRHANHHPLQQYPNLPVPPVLYSPEQLAKAGRSY